MVAGETKVSPAAETPQDDTPESVPEWMRYWFSFHNIENDTWEEVPRGVIHPRSRFSTRWQFLVLASLVYICAYIPFETR